jgi:hypothetical protein
MASIQISELHPTGSDLFADSESFLTDLGDNDFSGVMGGTDVSDTLWDWCTTTRTITSRTILSRISFETINPIGDVVINQNILH